MMIFVPAMLGAFVRRRHEQEDYWAEEDRRKREAERLERERIEKEKSEKKMIADKLKRIKQHEEFKQQCEADPNWAVFAELSFD